MCQGRAFIVEVLFPMTIARCAVLAASLAAYWLWVRVFVRFSGTVGEHLVMEGSVFLISCLSHDPRMHRAVQQK